MVLLQAAVVEVLAPLSSRRWRRHPGQSRRIAREYSPRVWHASPRGRAGLPEEKMGPEGSADTSESGAPIVDRDYSEIHTIYGQPPLFLLLRATFFVAVGIGAVERAPLLVSIAAFASRRLAVIVFLQMEWPPLLVEASRACGARAGGRPRGAPRRTGQARRCSRHTTFDGVSETHIIRSQCIMWRMYLGGWVPVMIPSRRHSDTESCRASSRVRYDRSASCLSTAPSLRPPPASSPLSCVG